MPAEYKDRASLVTAFLLLFPSTPSLSSISIHAPSSNTLSNSSNLSLFVIIIKNGPQGS